MTLIDRIKQDFPLYVDYFIGEDQEAVDALVTAAINSGLNRMTAFVPDLSEENITDHLYEILLAIVKKLAFGRKHDDAEFEHKPQILKDYDDALKLLERYKAGEFDFDATPDEDTDEEKSIRMTAKPKRFGEWFNG
ncbi:MAG: hypothetical protein H8E26_14185 [FCB group bacterium]|nr:hypothetical protein [FCB group bacterium]MBL7027433.1 hypothetical protein [Candidatus Neomarinimicrobiota bacterium]